MIFSTYTQAITVGGVSQAFIALFKPNLAVYVNSSNEIISLSETISFEEVVCGINFAVNEEYTTASKGSFIYNNQIQFEMSNIPRNITPMFDGKRFIVIFQSADKNFYIMGLDNGLKLQAASNSPGTDTTNSSTIIRIADLQRHEYYKCTPTFVNDIILGGIVDAPQNFNAWQ